MVLMSSFVGSRWSRLLLSYSGKVGCWGCNALQCVPLVCCQCFLGFRQRGFLMSAPKFPNRLPAPAQH